MDKFLYSTAVIVYAGLCFYLANAGKPAELAGFAVAGALSLAFLKIDSFKEFSGAGFSAIMKERVESLEKDIEPIKSKETEPDEISNDENLLAKSSDESGLDPDSKKVLSALTNSRYSWRTMSGLKSESKLPSNKIYKILHSLEKNNLASTSKSSAGKEIWGATMRGYIVNSMEQTGVTAKSV